MAKCDRYHHWVQWSEEDQAYLGLCPDVITGIHGDDPVQVYGDLREVVEEAVACLEAERLPLPEPTVRPMRELR